MGVLPEAPHWAPNSRQGWRHRAGPFALRLRSSRESRAVRRRARVKARAHAALRQRLHARGAMLRVMDQIAEPRSIDRYFAHYGADHRNHTNQLIHWLCVPLILWSVIALLWLVPVPARLGRPGLWAAVAMFVAFLWYYRQSRRLGLAMALAFVVLAFVTELLFRGLGVRGLAFLAIVVFVGAWIGQAIGHHIEGRKPSFFTDVFYLLIGPAWLMAKTMRRLRVPY